MELSPFSPDDIPLLPDLYRACFGAQVTEEFFHWKYLRNPYGRVVAWKATESGRIVAFYGLLPDEFSRGSETQVVFQSMDTMTHPDFQRRGLFLATAEATFREAQAQHEALRLFGIPGSRSLPGFLKLGWTHAHDFQLCFQHASLLGIGAPAMREVAAGSPELINYFQDRIRPTGVMERTLDSGRFDWLVARHPLYKFEVLARREEPLRGFVVSREMSPGRRLVQLIDARDPSARPELAVDLLRGLAARHRAAWIYAWEPMEPGLRQAFRRAGMIVNPLPRGPFSHRVPLILHARGETPGSWLNAAGVDWQAIYQD